MFSTDKRSGLQAGPSSTKTLLLQCDAVVIDAVCSLALACWNIQGICWKGCHLDASRSCAVLIASQIVALLFSAYGVASMHWKKNLIRLTTIQFYSLRQSIWNELWPRGDVIISISCSHMISPLHDRASACNSGWHSELCSIKIISRSVPEAMQGFPWQNLYDF